MSHDRTFLDRVVTRILELRLPDHDAAEHAGGWSDYVAARELARRQQYEGYEKYTAERDRLQQRQRTQREWAVVGVKNAKAKKTDNDKFLPHLKSQRSEKMAAKAKATEKAIERLDVVEKPWEPWELQLELKAADALGRRRRPTRRGRRCELGSFRLGPIDLEVAWQDRVAILGPNGSGKTTLLRALLGEVDAGERPALAGPGREGRAARPAPAPLRRRPAAAAAPSWTRPGSTAARLARSWPSSASAPTTSIGAGSDLSPGERTRALLAELMAEGVNCLVLDEPTNHLDLEAIEQLESALEGFDGTLLLVTHDRAFLDAVHVTTTSTSASLVVELDGPARRDAAATASSDRPRGCPYRV